MLVPLTEIVKTKGRTLWVKYAVEIKSSPWENVKTEVSIKDPSGNIN